MSSAEAPMPKLTRVHLLGCSLSEYIREDMSIRNRGELQTKTKSSVHTRSFLIE